MRRRGRVVRRTAMVFLWGLLALGCEDEPPPLELPPVTPIVRPRLLSPRAVATTSAFDLITRAGGGAALVYSPPSRAGGGVLWAPVDAFGTRQGDELTLFASTRPPDLAGPFVAADAAEIAAARGGDRAAVIWVERNDGRLSAVAALGEATGAHFGPPRRLGPTPLRRVGGRGQVAVAMSEVGVPEVRWRGPDGPCEQGATERCALVRGARLGATESGREDLPRALPEPCPLPIAGAAYAGGVWYFGVCDRTGGAPATTVLGVDFELSYAQSQRVLAGCEPLGFTVTGDAAVIAGRCGGERRMVSVQQAGRLVGDLGSVTPSVTCDGAHPVLHAGALSVPLGGPADGLEALLPDGVAPRGARAVWTGQSLLVATPIGREVSLHRYQCEHGELSPTDGP